MSKFLIGSYILNKFKSKLEINATNTNITILDDSGKTITPGENALVPNCVYQIIAEPIGSDYELSLLQVNGEDTGSGKYFEVGVGEAITITATSQSTVVQEPEYTLHMSYIDASVSNSSFIGGAI